MHFPKSLQYAAGLLLVPSLALADPPLGTVEITSVTWASEVAEDCASSDPVATLSEDQKTIFFHLEGMNADVQTKPDLICAAIIYLHYPDGYKYKLEGALHGVHVDLGPGVVVDVEVTYEIVRTDITPLLLESTFGGGDQGTELSVFLEDKIGSIDLVPTVCGAPTDPIQMVTVVTMVSDDAEAQGIVSMTEDNGEDIVHEIRVSWEEC